MHARRARCERQAVRASAGAKGAAGGALLEENVDHVSAWPAGSTDKRNLRTCRGRTCQLPRTRGVCGASGAGNACACSACSPGSLHTVSLEATCVTSASPFFFPPPPCSEDLQQSTGRTGRPIWRARRERQGVAGRQATQAARRLRVVGMTTPRLAERNRMRADARGPQTMKNARERCHHRQLHQNLIRIFRMCIGRPQGEIRRSAC